MPHDTSRFARWPTRFGGGEAAPGPGPARPASFVRRGASGGRWASVRRGRTGRPDLAASYMRLYAGVSDASSDLAGDVPDLAAATSACPVGLPLEEVAAAVRRMSLG